MVGKKPDPILAAPAQRQQRHPADWRIGQLLPELYFLLVKTDIIVAARILDRRMKRRERLHKHLALDVASTGATGHLRKQLERPLAGAEVRDVQA